ncbi:MAG: response regulator [Lachnospiraceae bacterium]|nr:response regulator [Lachnospiraceae bacterium]
MRILLVDDEKMALEDLLYCVKQALKTIREPEAELVATTSWKEALEKAGKEAFDVAFLDINMPGKNGLELGEELSAMNSSLNLIYVSAYDEYAVSANKLHISGYLMKPADVDAIVEEMKHLRYQVGEKPDSSGFRIRCFGNFEVFYDEKPLYFRRQKTKELFAYLVDKNGAAATADEICHAIFDSKGSDASHKNTLRVLAMELKQILAAHGLKDAYTHTRNAYSIRPELLECDYFRYMNGERELYQGKYMEQYEKWAYI